MRLLFHLAILIPACDSSSPAFRMYSAYKLNKQDDNIPWCTLFPNFGSVCCSMSSLNCCFLTCTQVLQEAGKVVWYSHLLKNYPVCCDPHKGFSIVNEAEMFFWNSFAFSMIQCTLAIWSLVPLPFLNSAVSGSSWFSYCWSLAWRILSIILLACEMNAIVW